MTSYTLEKLAQHIGGELQGAADCPIEGITSLAQAGPKQISFLSDSKLRSELASTHAAAVILSPDDAAAYAGNKILIANPYLAFAQVAALFDRRPIPSPGIHESASIAKDAELGENVSIGPFVTIGNGARIGAGSVIGPNTSIGNDSEIGEDSQIAAGVQIYHGVRIGNRAIIHSGVVIGSDGFGFANDQGRWIKIPQIGGVEIGDDVEIGANTTIDRGALENTRIGNGVKMDNQIQVAHNVQIGEHTAIAGCVGIAGSAKIGRFCGIGGGAGILGHLEITDGVQVTAMSLVTKSIKDPGVYSSGTSVEPSKQWHKNYARFRQLDEMARRIKTLEQRLEKNKE
ncbi:MAG: UDP-3-O-(3-hydroxymyristoyl)glucosamine N-acyltransferase [Gammaproteobacteria bacterium]|nr:UDP-3-O-(3-hydroxymyristoyl)glucosamine N-acyltransferase [Gammaproteobacteria bacterium]